MTTFIATSAKEPAAASLKAFGKTIAGTQFSLSYGDTSRNQPAVTLCYDGPREHADAEIVAEFKRIAKP